MQFSLLDLTVNDTWWYKLHPPHVISVATLPCESRNAEKCNITVGYYQRKLHQMHRMGSSKWTCRLLNLGHYMQQCVYKTKIRDIDEVQKCLMQTWFDFEQNVIDAAIDEWRDHLRSCVRAGGGHFEHILWNYCSFVLHGSSEHFMKLSV